MTTVGYGDHVPTNTVGRALAAVATPLGIGFLTVITASITGSFVARSRRDREEAGEGAATARELREISERLDRIEAALRDRA